MTLRELAESFVTATGYESGAAKIYRHFNATLNKVAVVFISDAEPTRVLPLNVVWLVLDKNSDYYLTFLRRTSKTPSAGFNNTWVPVTSVNSVWAEQYYDAIDGNPDALNVPLATETTSGIAKLTTGFPSAASATFVADEDTRLADDRYPIDHTHPEKPLREVVGVVSMDNGAPVEGATFVSSSASSADQRRVTNTDLGR